jgi:poly-gamma-glutamate synthesis protein (capsule biosynthesis protein)
MIARVLVDQRGVQQAGFVPCYINERAQPVPVTEAAGSDATTDYIKRITADAGLEATFAPAGDWVTFLNQSA